MNEDIFEKVKYLDERILAWNRETCTAFDFADTFSDYEIDLLIGALESMPSTSINTDYYPEKCDTYKKAEVICDYISRILCELIIEEWGESCRPWFNLYCQFDRSRSEDYYYSN